jgi:hypothetical protein
MLPPPTGAADPACRPTWALQHLWALALFLPRHTQACTNILVSSGASADGSTQLAYNADSGSLFGSLGHYPRADHPPGTNREIWDWDGSFFLGEIPEVNHTYNVVGNANEHGLIIGETTFGGLPTLAKQPGAVMDYGSLIWVRLAPPPRFAKHASMSTEILPT